MPTADKETLRQLNLYEVLQISARASPEMVQAAYRVMARTFHPDVNASPQAARMMRQINAAYRVLSDPERRARYDAQRLDWRPRSSQRVARRTTASGPTKPPPISVAARRPVALPVTPVRSGWRVGRLLGLLVVLLVMLGALVFAFWVIAGVLEDEPIGPIHAAVLHREPTITFNVM
jgi:hypothetical protein